MEKISGLSLTKLPISTVDEPATRRCARSRHRIRVLYEEIQDLRRLGDHESAMRLFQAAQNNKLFMPDSTLPPKIQQKTMHFQRKFKEAIEQGFLYWGR